ncbi:MAG: fructose-bisphosphate aldolase, class [Solirubrobacteraceae bacterium]|jgi:fructose-bisphosphate aldolase class I|nr:fructose-bisphosphate aldolase, class [Solirubrobacteraceae bacterium]MEA2299869.1 fructose-bisphosphate aldolase, class [Solirubrobacteraceae bacterium]MEA2356662.1 fructose-bisphosphate aldolase, class [Solirubrobacteraceae bacterium]
MSTTSSELEQSVHDLLAAPRGILAADESIKTMSGRLEKLGIEPSRESRVAYRNLLATTPGLGGYISGMILFDETIRQTLDDGTPFAEAIGREGIIPGIKVDTGAKPLAGAPGETVTEGLDGLRERLVEYKELGARFAKWRAVINIGDGLPTAYAVEANAHALARYAALCQEAGIVPIVEPEVLMEGDHSIDRCEEVTTSTLRRVFAHLAEQRVALEGMLLKPNMVIPGKQAAQQATPEEVAEATVRCFKRVVPAAVPGIVFLSGGQSPEEATANLNAINKIGGLPWRLSFSFGRALQDQAVAAWAGEDANRDAAQEALLERSRANAEASTGDYAAAPAVA